MPNFGACIVYIHNIIRAANGFFTYLAFGVSSCMGRRLRARRSTGTVRRCPKRRLASTWSFIDRFIHRPRLSHPILSRRRRGYDETSGSQVADCWIVGRRRSMHMHAERAHAARAFPVSGDFIFRTARMRYASNVRHTQTDKYMYVYMRTERRNTPALAQRATDMPETTWSGSTAAHAASLMTESECMHDGILLTASGQPMAHRQGTY